MDKKKVIIFLIIAGAILLFLYKDTYINQKPYLYQMSGHIIEVKENSIVITGPVKSLDPTNTRQEQKTIEFQVIPQTVLKNTANIITIENIKSGEPFTPKTEEKPGYVSDLAVSMKIISIQSKEDLFAVDKAIADEINYFTYDFKLPPQ